MKFSVSPKAPKVDLLLIPLFKGESLSKHAKAALGADHEKAFKARVKAKDFDGSEGQSLVLYGDTQVVLIGRGEEDKQMPGATELLGGTLAQHSKGKKSVAIVLGNDDDLGQVACGYVLGSYEFTRYKTKPKKEAKSTSTKVHFVCGADTKSVAKLPAFSSASTLLRDLVNTPAGDLTTRDMEKEARAIGKKYGLKVTVFDEAKLKKLGCGSIVGVGQGAENTAKMIFLEYKNKSTAKNPDLALIGKGVVFDTGGLNLKPTGYIETMKQDMAGSATVLATMQAIADTKLKGYFLGVLCCAENAVSEKAIRPGDVLKAYNGKTIEVTNTDAEGRLCLADGLSYVEANYKPKAMINIATLTGAVSVALGYNITGVMGNNQDLVDKILSLSEDNYERMWQLPLDPDFIKATKGDFTDVKNSTNGVRAGATMGAAFLSNFVDKTPWAHFDIGGTAWAEKPSSTTKYGSTAAALRTLYALAESYAK